MSYFDILAHAKETYLSDGRKVSIARAGKELTELVRSPYASEENREAAEILLQKLRLKNAFLTYMAELDDDSLALANRAAGAITQSTDPSCARIAGGLLDTLELFSPAITEINRIYFGLFDEMGELSSDGSSDIAAAHNAVAREASKIATLDLPNPFSEDGVRMPDIKAHLLKKTDAVLKMIDAQKETLLASSFGKDYGKLVTVYREQELPYMKDGFTYFPALYRPEDNDRARILHTPYREEALLLAAASAKAEEHALAVIDFTHDEAYPNGFWTYLSSRMREDDVRHLFVAGLKHVANYTETALPRLVSLATSDGRYVYFFDPLSDETPSLYRECRRLSEAGKLDMTRVSYHYLSMPTYHETAELLESLHKITLTADGAELRRSCKFMGFVGLNLVALSPGHGSFALAEAKRLSDANRAAVNAYITRIPSRLQFIDEGWGELGDVQFTSRRDDKNGFDYDALDAFDRRNVEAILENDKTTYIEKCGQVVHYALLQNNDISFWKSLDATDKRERITRATHLLARTLDLEYKDPAVEFHSPEEDETLKTATGYCAEGGSRIVYHIKSLNEYPLEDMRDIICHELYHSLQHHLIRCGWQEWHQVRLGISESRVQRWKENFDGKYQEPRRNKNAYLVQVVEADARSFAEETARGCRDAWTTIRFY